MTKVIDWGGVFFMTFLTMIIAGFVSACIQLAYITPLTVPFISIAFGIIGLWILVILLYIEEGIFTDEDFD